MNRPAALAVVAVAGVAALAVGFRGFGDDDHKQTFDQKISEVRLESGRSDVEIVAADVSKVEVQRRIHSFWLFPRRAKAAYVDGDALVLPVGCGWGCGVDYTVRVPRGVDVTGESGSGEVSLDGVGRVDVRLGSGDLELANAAGPVTVEVRSGSIDADQIRGDATLQTRSGDVRVNDVGGKSVLRTNSGGITVENARDSVDAQARSGDVHVELAAPGSVRAKTNSGSVELEVPRGAYHVVTQTSSGETDVEIADDPNASSSLEASTSSGDVSIQQK